jgi:hypothetical protein
MTRFISVRIKILFTILILIFVFQRPISLFIITYITPGKHRFEQRMLGYALQTIDLPNNYNIESDPDLLTIPISESLALINFHYGFSGNIKWKENKSNYFFLYEPTNHFSALIAQLEEDHPLTKSIKPKISNACFKEPERKELEDYFNGILKNKIIIYQKYHALARDCTMRFGYEGSQYRYLFEVYSFNDQDLQIQLQWPI